MKLEKSTQITLIIVVGIIILAVLGFLFLGQKTNKNTITVSGQSTIKVMPDLITVYFNVEAKGKTAKEASDKNSEIVSNLTYFLGKIGFEKESIKTQSFSVYPEYDWRKGFGEIINYKATHSLKVEIPANRSEKIGEVIDSGVNAGAGISYVNFELTLESQNKYKGEAMKLAAQDATLKARGVADGLGKRLGNVISVSIDNYNYYPWLARDFSGVTAEEAKQEATNIQPSEQQISAIVTAIFEIK